MKNYSLIIACLVLMMSQACNKDRETEMPEIAFDDSNPIALALDTVYADSLTADTISIPGSINLKIYKGTHEVERIVVSFWDSTFATVKKANGQDSLIAVIPAYEEKLRPKSIDPFSVYASERLSFVFYPKRNRFEKYCWRIYVLDTEGNSSNILHKSVVVKFP